RLVLSKASSAAAGLELGLIGNCQVASLSHAQATHVWTCLPRLDGDPVFCALLAGSSAAARQGGWAVELFDQVSCSQTYERHTAILETTLTDAEGAVLSPAQDYGARARRMIGGSHHIRFVGLDFDLRLTTNASIAVIQEQRVFVLDDTLAFILGPDETVHESVPMLAQRLLDSTREYWNDWVRSLAVPFEWQEAVIRAAITLKLCSYEDTGAIIAAITTSIPESANSGRNWDYRYCWIRDTYFTVQALNRLGATRTMEGYLRFIQNLTATPPLRLQPCYGIDGNKELVETIVPHLAGYRGMGPVRVGNAAYEQVQHDVYGAAILAVTQSFFDERLVRPGTQALFETLEPLGEQSLAEFGKPDAGIWEYRGHTAVHTFSSAVCWAAAERLARIAGRLGLSAREK